MDKRKKEEEIEIKVEDLKTELIITAKVVEGSNNNNKSNLI